MCVVCVCDTVCVCVLTVVCVFGVCVKLNMLVYLRPRFLHAVLLGPQLQLPGCRFCYAEEAMLRDVVDTLPRGRSGPVSALLDPRVEETLGVRHAIHLLDPEVLTAVLNGLVELLPRVDVLAAHRDGDAGSTLIHLVVGVALWEETDEDAAGEEVYSTDTRCENIQNYW